jgi:hypothetical protein
MNWYKVFYWLTVADNAKDFFLVFIVIFTGISVVATCCYFFYSGIDGGQSKDDSASQKVSRKWIFWAYPFMMIFWALYVFTPSKTDSLVIICGGAVGNFITSDSSSAKIPADLTRYLHMSFEKEIKDLDSDTKAQLGLQTPKEKFTDKLQDMTKDQIIEYLKNDTTVSVK